MQLPAQDCDEKRRSGSMKNWKKGMIAGSIICIATGFLFIGIGSSMGGWTAAIFISVAATRLSV